MRFCSRLEHFDRLNLLAKKLKNAPKINLHTQSTLLTQYEQVLYNQEFDFDKVQRDQKLVMLRDYGVIGRKPSVMVTVLNIFPGFQLNSYGLFSALN